MHDLRIPSFQDIVARLILFVALERKILALIATYSVVMGVCSLGVPIAVQELVSTFSFAIEPRMVATLAAVVLITLLVVAAFRVLQARAVEILNQQIYTRVALAFTATLPRLHEDMVLPAQAHRFFEAELITRALVAMIADLLNVLVVGTIGMTLLLFYHPVFLLYNVAVIGGFIVLLTIFGQGTVLINLEMSRLHYATFGWIQNIADNLPHLRAVPASEYLMKRTDELTSAYVLTRKRRSDIMTGHQYKASAIWQAFAHSGLILTAGLLVADGQLTVGQFAAAEVVMGNLLLNMDTLSRRMVAFFYLVTSFHELAEVFSLPRREEAGEVRLPAPQYGMEGVKVCGKDLSFGYPGFPPLFQRFNLEVAAGEKIAVLCQTNTVKTALAKVLAGLSAPTTGFVRYDGVALTELSLEAINACRGFVLDSHPRLLDGTLKDNITLGRPTVTYEDLQWALRFVELDEDVDALPQGLNTPVVGQGRPFTLSQILRILVARAIIVRPRLLIFDGTLHSMLPATRETILRRLCSKEEFWTVIFVSNDPAFKTYVDRTVSLP